MSKVYCGNQWYHDGGRLSRGMGANVAWMRMEVIAAIVMTAKALPYGLGVAIITGHRALLLARALPHC
jgi:hypothetical protein